MVGWWSGIRKSFRNVHFYHMIVMMKGYSIDGRKELVLFDDALNTFSYGYMSADIWLRTIQIVRKPDELLFPISSKGSFICTIPQTG